MQMGCLFCSWVAVIPTAPQRQGHRLFADIHSDWRRGVNNEDESRLLSLFADSPHAPFSIHRFVKHGAECCGKYPGEWFGPSATALCIQYGRKPTRHMKLCSHIKQGTLRTMPGARLTSLCHQRQLERLSRQIHEHRP